MFKFVRGRILLTVQCVFALLFTIYIVKSDFFLEYMSPDLYWEKKVASFENNIALSKYKVDELNLFLNKENELFKYTLKNSKQRAEAFGENEEELIKQATKEYEKKVASINDDLDYFTKNLEKSQILLLSAKQEHGKF